MRWLLLFFLLLGACSNGDQKVLEGVILEIRPGQLLVEHEAISGLSGAGTSVFNVRNAEVLRTVKAGDTIRAGVYVDERGAHVVRLRKTGEGDLPPEYTAEKHRLKGVILDIKEGSVVIDHEPIIGVMGAMVMPFNVLEPTVVEGLSVGDKIIGTYYINGASSWVGDLQKAGTEKKVFRKDVSPLRIGERFPLTAITLEDGSEFILGQEGERPVVLTFIYTTCPDPEACPAMMSRYQALYAQVESEAILLAISLDPAVDTLEALASYAKLLGAKAPSWRFGRVDQDLLQELAMRAGMNVIQNEGKIVHGLRVLVLDSKGALIERYDDTRWPLERVVSQIRTGDPRPPSDTLGSHYPKE
jgi:protein SCO1